MNKRGFIATALIYSFFLIFCAVLVSFIGMSEHNKNLLSKANDNIREDLKLKLLGNTEYGSYVYLDIVDSNINLSDLSWIVFNHDASNTLLVSDSIVYSIKDNNGILYDDVAFINNTINEFSINGEVLKAPTNKTIRIITYTDFDLMKTNATTKELVIAFAGINTTSSVNASDVVKYLIIDNTNYNLYTYNIGTSSDLNTYKNEVFDHITSHPTNDYINIRLVISIPNETKIQGGNGNISNAYTLLFD